MSTQFDSGQIVVTGGIHAFMEDNPQFRLHVHHCLARHLSGDWGDLCKEDWATNEEALLDGYRLFSAYKQEGMQTIWIITEADRSVTTILLPEEY